MINPGIPKYVFTEVPIESLYHLRNEYLNGLVEPQELFLELKVRSGRQFLIFIDGGSIGYFITSSENALIEIFLTDPYITQIEYIFKEIVNRQHVKRAFTKTFDYLFLIMCLTYQKSSKILGPVFRDFIKSDGFLENTNISHRLGQMEDIGKLLPFIEGIFESEDEIRSTIVNKNLFVYEMMGVNLGFGIFQPVIPGRVEYDIGMAVHPIYRMQGIGTYIIRHLVDFCNKNGWRPVCGCAQDNCASRYTLEKAGFITRHAIVDFSF